MQLFRKKRILTILILIFVLFLLVSNKIISQERFTQTIRGTIVDKQTKMPLIGANVILVGYDPLIGTSSDINGYFRLENVTVGRHNLRIIYLGYEDVVINEIEIVSGKEVVLTIEMIEKVIEGGEVIIKAQKSKARAINEMSAISSRTFSVEETSKYAGSWGDPSRMAANFAGVTAISDKRNDIVVRGNSPIGVLWRMDGIEIPNPNHFSVAGSSGGGISMINNNLLNNSDFLTGAFSAEYGNALSAVFDLKMRIGNNEKKEYIAQVGVNGFEIGCEGPFKKGKKSSYLVNYRYSTLALLNLMGISIIEAVPKFQDLSFKLNFPIKKGSISLFGIGGKSSAIFHVEKDSIKWKNGYDQFGNITGSQMGIIGLSYLRLLNNKTYMKLMFSSSVNNPFFIDDSIGYDYNVYEVSRMNMMEGKNSVSIMLNKKLNSKHKVRWGFQLYNMYINNNAYYNYYIPEKKQNVINFTKGNVTLFQGYSQWKYNLTSRFTLNTGFHLLYFFFNKKYSIEPRIALNWNFTPTQSLGIGYGMHRQLQPTPVYFTKIKNSQGTFSMPNKDMDFTQSRHYVLTYDFLFTEHLRTKVEAYYQHINNVPVDIQNPVFSLLNFGTDDNIFTASEFSNDGEGSNYGIEFTLEKFLSNSYYFLITTSLYNSKYLDGNNKKRNTRYNCNFANNILVGKEFKIGGNNSISINITIVNIGGQRYTPIDLNTCLLKNTTIVIDSLAYSEQ